MMDASIRLTRLERKICTMERIAPKRGGRR